MQKLAPLRMANFIPSKTVRSAEIGSVHVGCLVPPLKRYKVKGFGGVTLAREVRGGESLGGLVRVHEQFVTDETCRAMGLYKSAGMDTKKAVWYLEKVLKAEGLQWDVNYPKGCSATQLVVLPEETSLKTVHAANQTLFEYLSHNGHERNIPMEKFKAKLKRRNYSRLPPGEYPYVHLFPLRDNVTGAALDSVEYTLQVMDVSDADKQGLKNTLNSAGFFNFFDKNECLFGCDSAKVGWNLYASARLSAYGLKPVVGDIVTMKMKKENVAERLMGWGSTWRGSDGVKVITDPVEAAQFSIHDVVLPTTVSGDVVYPTHNLTKAALQKCVETAAASSRAPTHPAASPYPYRHIVALPLLTVSQFTTAQLPTLHQDHLPAPTSAPLRFGKPPHGVNLSLKITLPAETSLGTFQEQVFTF